MASIRDCLYSIRSEVDNLELRLKEETDPYHQENLKILIAHKIYQGIRLIEMAKPGEVSYADRDYYFGRTNICPDMARLDRIIRQKEREIIENKDKV